MYFDHGVYLNMMDLGTLELRQLPHLPRCRAPLKEKKPWDGKRVGMENLLKIELKIGAHAIKLPIFLGFLFFLVSKKI